MNKIYKVVWNTVRNCYVVGSEFVSSCAGQHSVSNHHASALNKAKTALAVLALCGGLTLAGGLAPTYAADAGSATSSQYVAVLVNDSNRTYGSSRTFDGYSYHKETIASTGESYWVRDGYTVKYETNKRYPGASKDNIIKAYKTKSYTSASDNGLLKSNQIMVESSGVSTLTNVDLDDVSGGTYVGATNSGSTSTPSSFNYMIKDDNGSYIDAGNSNYSTHFAAATKNSDGTYSYNGEVLSNDNLYVISSTDYYGNTTNKVGVFLTSSGKVYTGKVFGTNNEVLMTTKNDDGTLYSYWGADTPDPNSKLADMTIGQFNQALEKVNNNSKAVAGDAIKKVVTTKATDGNGGTISLLRRGTYNAATGKYEGEHYVDGGLTLTSTGGTGGSGKDNDVKIKVSNGTDTLTLDAGTKVEAIGTNGATTGLKINGEEYTISATDYRVIANPAEGSKGIYKPDASGNITLTVEDAKTGATSTVQLSDIAKSDLSNITEEGDTYITKVANKAVKVIDGQNTTVTPGKDGDVTTYAVNVDTSGKIEQNNNNIVTGDTVYNALQNVSWTAKVNGADAKTVAKDGTLNFVSGDNIAISAEKGDIKISTTGLASSGDLWTAQAGGTDVKAVNQKVNFVGSDHITVTGTDGQIQFEATGLADTDFNNITNNAVTKIQNIAKGEDVHIKADTYTVGKDGSVTMTYVDGNGKPVTGEAKITGIAKSDLSNITKEGDTYITKVANKAVKVIDGKNTTVTPGKDGDVTTYAVNVDTSGKIEQNNNNIVTGDTVYNALQNVSWTAKVNGDDAKIVAKDGTLNFVDGDNIAISAENGNIKISTTGLASSGDLWTARVGTTDVRPVDKKVNFAGSDHITVTGSDGQITFATTGLADTNFTNITEEGNTYIKKLAKGEDVHIKADTYTVGNDGSVTMTYVDGNGKPVAGEATITGIAKSDLTNITEGGKTVINNLAKEAVKVVDGTNTKVREGTLDNGKIKTYAVDVKTDGTINKGDTNIVTGDTVYNALQNVSWKAQVNGRDAKIVAKDGTLNFVDGNNIAISAENGNIKISTTGLASSGDLWTAQAGGKDVKAVNQKVNFVGSDHITVTGTDGQIKFETTGLADTDFTNITNTAVTKIKNLAKGEDRHIEAKEYAVDKDGSVTMTYVDGNGNQVAGTAKITGIAKSDLTNITEGGKTIINKLAQEAVKVVNGTNTTVTEGNDGKAKTYAVNVDNAAIQAATDVTGENGISVTSAVENGVKKYAVSAKLSNNFAIDQATGNIDLAPSIAVGKTNPVTINGNTGEIMGLSNKTTTAANFADGSGRAATEEQLKEVNSKATAAKTTVTAGKNIAVNGKSDENGSAYTVALADDVSLGNNAIQLKGTDGSISAKSGGAQLAFNNSGLTVSQAKNGLTNETRIDGATITVDGGAGNQTIINGSTARIGSVLVNGGSGTATISGLTNQTTNYTGFANGSGRAATEEQLKEVAGKAGEAVETAGKGWNLTTNGKESSKTNIKPDGTVDFSSGNDNLVISNAGANLSFSLSDNLDLTNNKDKKGSVKVGENTALTDELLQVGKDVSLTASALNVGNSSLTTSALMVGGLTYINSSGINANSRVISNVAAGVLGTDAVNVDQLKSAISGSQVSIKAGDGISVAKTGNQYTINVNIEGVTNNQGKVTVSTGDSTSTESGSESGSSGAKKFKVMDLMYRAESNEVAPETTTETGKPMKIESIPEDIKFEADDNQAAHVVNGETIKIAGDGTNISTKANVTGAGSNKLDTISVSLKPDIRVDSVTINNGPTINSRGIDMNSQKITNLAEGDISETSTDAVNGSQLYNTNQAVIANAENINSLSHSLNKLDSRINRVGAGAAALAALHPLDFDPDNKWDFAAGYGNYAGANAVAIGTYYRPNENTMFSIGGSFGGGENMVNAGVSFKLGQGGSGISTSKVAMAKKIKAQDELLKAQDAKMKEQDEKIAKLEALVAQQGEMIKQALNK
ncbi:YadA-like family protein [uncultured Megasphaera sp.]|uniref:YadA-like family protein n=1 Tax=uncultured Megasphaera sp. TaxID=165188 RepID=UPI002869292A|nr:YadA-like family protein [uncultured Megasphaera sp.]